MSRRQRVGAWGWAWNRSPSPSRNSRPNPWLLWWWCFSCGCGRVKELFVMVAKMPEIGDVGLMMKRAALDRRATATWGAKRRASAECPLDRAPQFGSPHCKLQSPDNPDSVPGRHLRQSSRHPSPTVSQQSLTFPSSLHIALDCALCSSGATRPKPHAPDHPAPIFHLPSRSPPLPMRYPPPSPSPCP